MGSSSPGPCHAANNHVDISSYIMKFKSTMLPLCQYRKPISFGLIVVGKIYSLLLLLCNVQLQQFEDWHFLVHVGLFWWYMIWWSDVLELKSFICHLVFASLSYSNFQHWGHCMDGQNSVKNILFILQNDISIIHRTLTWSHILEPLGQQGCPSRQLSVF